MRGRSRRLLRLLISGVVLDGVAAAATAAAAAAAVRSAAVPRDERRCRGVPVALSFSLPIVEGSDMVESSTPDSESIRGTVNLRHVFASYSETLSGGRLGLGCAWPLLSAPREGPVGVEGEPVGVIVDVVGVIVEAVAVIVDGEPVESCEIFEAFEAFEAFDAWEPAADT